MQPIEAGIEAGDDEEAIAPNDDGGSMDDGGDDGQGIDPEEAFRRSTNPLEPIGRTFEAVVQTQINEDTWSAMIGDLPCLEVTESCIRELQETAIANNFTLQEIDARIEAINERIELARANNQRSIRLGIWEPLWQDLITMRDVQRVPDPSNPPAPGSEIRPERRGFIENVLDIFVNPVNGVNRILSMIGVPLFRTLNGGSDAQQQREIGIADLQVKVAQVERERAEMANKLREEVMLSVLDFERTRREFQAYQEMGRRSQLRSEVLGLNYRFVADSISTPQYLSEMNSLDGQYLNVYRAWALLRTQLTRIKLLVLGSAI